MSLCLAAFRDLPRGAVLQLSDRAALLSKIQAWLSSWNGFAVGMIAPLKAQLKLLERMLGDKARDGSVNCFKEKEAHFPFYSITLSSLLSARAIDFVHYPNCMSVAVSPTKHLSNIFCVICDCIAFSVR